MPTEITTDDEPKLSVALQSPERHIWLDAIEEEFQTLIAAGTWVSPDTPPPPGKVIPSNVVLKLKRDENGLPARFKGRVVALGNMQSDQLGLVELYAPVTCIETVRIIFSIAGNREWKIHQIDVVGAFLYALLSETDEIWIKLPNIDGVESANGQIVRLRKSLYGLRQAPKLWYKWLSAFMAEKGFHPSKVNDCLFVKNTASGNVYVLVYVDDMLITGNDEGVTMVKHLFSERFIITDLGVCHHFLRIKIEYTPNGIFLSQRPYMEKIIQPADMSTAKPAECPLPLSHCLYETRTDLMQEEKDYMRTVPYRNILGSLIFLSTRTRPDISTAVSMLGKYQEEPSRSHWNHLKQVVRYIIRTKSYGLFFPNGSGEINIVGWSDADWARDTTNRRSRSGYLITVSECPVVWSSKLQTSTALSTSEAEFFSLAQCTREICWIRELLVEFDAMQSEPTELNQDNLGTISWTEEVQGMRRVKHIGVKYHYVRDVVNSGAVQVQPVASEDNRSDSLTKVLVGEEYKIHRNWLGVIARPVIEGECQN